MSEKQLALRQKLLALTPEQTALPVMVGLDGFVDKIIRVVRTRHNHCEYVPMETMSELGAMISAMAGKSCNVELVVTRSKLGGNGPIMANALMAAGCQVDYVGALGNPVDPVFAGLAAACHRCCSVAEPGFTDALEFDDGKIMLGKHAALIDVNWDRLIEHIGMEELTRMLTGNQLVAMTNWTMLAMMDGIWQGIQREVLAGREHLSSWLFVDLADPAKRTAEDIQEALELISEFSRWYHVVLGLNESEGYQIARVLGCDGNKGDDLQKVAQDIFARMRVENVVIHPTRYAVAADKHGTCRIDGPFCTRPTLTTGAGDNFNAGFCLGRLLGLDLEDSLLSAVATSGHYVRAGASPTISDQVALLERWDKGTLN